MTQFIRDNDNNKYIKLTIYSTKKHALVGIVFYNIFY